MRFAWIPIVLLACAPTPPAEVQFSTSDGGVVGAHIYGDGGRFLVLVHGGRFDKESWEEEARAFAAEGFRVIAIDMRGRGISHGGSQEHAERDIHLDVLAAVNYAHESGAKTVSVIGASLGGWAAAQAAVEAEPGAIDRVVMLAATGIQEPERIQGRKLFIVARGDLTGNGRPRLESIQNQYGRAPEPKQLVVLEGDAHAQFVFDSPQGGELMRELLRFLKAP